MKIKLRKQILSIIILGVIAGFFQFSSAFGAAGQQTLNSGWLLETAKNTVLTSEPWKSAGCDVEISSVPADITVYKSGKIEVSGILKRTPNGIKDIGSVSIEVYVDGELYLRFDPSQYLTVSVEVWTANRNIDRGEIIRESDLEKKNSDVRSLPSRPALTDIADIVGKSAKMNIQSGKIISDELIENPILVKHGDSVVVYVPVGGAYVTMTGTALDSGAKGDEIRVKNPDSNKIVTAIVTDTGKARAKT